MKDDGEHLRLHVKSTLPRYDISVSQVCSVTTDNGINMLKAVRLLSGDENESEGPSSDEEANGSDLQFEAYGPLSLSLLDNPKDTRLLGMDDEDLLLGAHTLQLVLSDALRATLLHHHRTVLRTCKETQRTKCHGTDEKARAKEAHH